MASPRADLTSRFDQVMTDAWLAKLAELTVEGVRSSWKVTGRADWLREHSIGQERWPGALAVYGESTPGGMWASVVTGIERRGDQWIVTRLDRNREPVDETGRRVFLKE